MSTGKKSPSACVAAFRAKTELTICSGPRLPSSADWMPAERNASALTVVSSCSGMASRYSFTVSP